MTNVNIVEKSGLLNNKYCSEISILIIGYNYNFFYEYFDYNTMPAGTSGQAQRVSSKATRKALQLRLGILGDEEIVAMSVTEGGITEEQLIDPRTRQAVLGGVHDPRMGTTDRDAQCGTCGCDAQECPGHFGHIDLAEPVYHPGYVTNVLKVLRCICAHCGALRLSKEERAEISQIARAPLRFKRVMEAAKANKNRACQKGENDTRKCGREDQPTFSKGKGLEIIVTRRGDAGGADGGADRKEILSAAEARGMLAKMANNQPGDAELLGMNPRKDAKDGRERGSRPEWMIIKVLPVGPPPIRPSVQAGDAQRSEDDLTYAYLEIVRANNKLRAMKEGGGAPRGAREEQVKTLQLLVATFMDNNIADAPKQKHTGGRPIKDIRSRLKGKEGRVRGNLMGKRVDFSARTVITPDPILQLDQLGVPEDIARNLTVPEPVTRENIVQMRQLVSNGPTRWPGAKYIIRHDGKQIDLANRRNLADADLDLGYVVERHLRDEDYVVFNRQPSLHKMSLMGHRVKVLPFKTFRLNLSVTSPYNADFDGDEMNMHVPQSYETKAEVKEIMAVPHQVVAPKDNKPVMGIVQDSLLGIMLFTQRDTFVELDQLMNLLMWLDVEGELKARLPPPAILKPRPLWTGKQLLSLVIPPVNFESRSGAADCPADKNVIVQNGELLSGLVVKKIVGATPGGLVHIIWKDLGPERCKIFMSDTQNLVNNWLVGNGMTVGVQDIIAPRKTVVQIEQAVAKRKRRVQRIVQAAQRGKLATLPGLGVQGTFEVSVNGALREALDVAGGLAHADLAPDNRLRQMVTSGSKGGLINISQIMACVGQQNVDGKRIPFGFNRRSLPHFGKDDFGPESKGFVTSCYVDGLTPQEFYFHAMGGREGLIDTAVKTADTGYIQRRLIKALEDVQVKYDGTVRTSRDNVIQFIYGEDGLEAQHIENLSIPLLKMDNAALKGRFDFFTGQREDAVERRQTLKESITENTVDELDETAFARLCSLLESESEQIRADREELRTKILRGSADKVWLPINMERLLRTARERFGVRPRELTDLTPDYVIEKTNKLLKDGIRVYQEPRLKASPLFVTANADATRLMKIYLRYHLASKQIIQGGAQEQRLTRQSFDWLLEEIKTRFQNALVNPGEMVGSIGAQSMGEPATQMTLNTFHLAGVGTKNVTLGVPRLKEVINVASTIKTPSLQIFLQQDEPAAYRGRGEGAEEWEARKKAQEDKFEQTAIAVSNALQHTTLGQLAASSAIYYDPDPRKTIIEADQALLAFHNAQMGVEDTAADEASSPWLWRLELSWATMAARRIDLEHIERVLGEALPGQELDIVRQDAEAEDDGVGIKGADSNEKLVLRVRLPDPVDADDTKTAPMCLRDLEASLLNDLTLKGVPAITKCTRRKLQSSEVTEVFYDPETGAALGSGGESNQASGFLVETDGVALKQVLGEDRVDAARTTSNSVRETLTVLGVEAARLSLIRELRIVLGSYGIYVNYRHLGTLCDIMTNRGVLTAITRHGINRVDSGALRKCSFEETVEILLEASFHAEIDPLSGVTENIIMGQLAPYGTGAFDIMADTDMIQREAVDTNNDVGRFNPNPFFDQFYDPTNWPFGMPMQQPGPPDDDYLNGLGATPIVTSPDHPNLGGNTPVGGMQSAYAAFTPGPNPDMGGVTSPAESPQYQQQYAQVGSSPIYQSPYGGGQTPIRGPTAGIGAGNTYGYSPTGQMSPAYPVAYGGGGGTTPHYNIGGGTTPGYAPGGPDRGIGGTSPAYAPNAPRAMSPAYGRGQSPTHGRGMSPAYGGTAGGGASPSYTAGRMATYAGGASSPAYARAGQSPAYGGVGGSFGPPNPAYSPTQDYNETPDGVYLRRPNQAKQPPQDKN